jgi:hypothetical protein
MKVVNIPEAKRLSHGGTGTNKDALSFRAFGEKVGSDSVDQPDAPLKLDVGLSGILQSAGGIR